MFISSVAQRSATGRRVETKKREMALHSQLSSFRSLNILLSCCAVETLIGNELLDRSLPSRSKAGTCLDPSIGRLLWQSLLLLVL